jgi:hypothetical protein
MTIGARAVSPSLLTPHARPASSYCTSQPGLLSM